MLKLVNNSDYDKGKPCIDTLNCLLTIKDKAEPHL